MNQGHKRNLSSTMDSTSKDEPPASPFLPMFETFRKELDEHHDRRERITKASRDITAASKKITSTLIYPGHRSMRRIFALQRVRELNQPTPPNISKAIQPHTTAILTLFASIGPELRSINTHRYNRQISPGLQEYMEARIFQHYLETQTILPYAVASAEIAQLATPTAGDNDPPPSSAAPQDRPKDDAQSVQLLTPDDYLLALFDATGEMMRFAITSMATRPALARTQSSGTVDEQRTVVHDLQALRLHLCNVEARSRFVYPMSKAVSGKLGVMLASVEKVERALYGLAIRGGERPSGWMPDLSAAAPGVGVDAEADG